MFKFKKWMEKQKRLYRRFCEIETNKKANSICFKVIKGKKFTNFRFHSGLYLIGIFEMNLVLVLLHPKQDLSNNEILYVNDKIVGLI